MPNQIEGAYSSKARASAEPKADKRRRSWTLREEQALIESLKEIISNGWKCENGFRVGYLGALEKCMVRLLPGTDLKAIPHINSKIHVWKKDHGSLQTMMSKSGFGWNDTSKMIQVDSDDVWEQYVKTDSNARSMRYKPYPFYHHWLEIFGKDRATGEHAEDFSTAGNGEAVGKHNAQEQNLAVEEEADGSRNNSVEKMDNSQSMDSATSKKNKLKRKNPVQLVDDRIVDLMGKFCQQTNSRLGEIAKRIGYDFDVAESRKAVFEALGDVPGLSLNEQIFIADKLVMNPQKLDLFFSLPENARWEMVSMLLSGQIA